jgi:hypothetical protein
MGTGSAPDIRRRPHQARKGRPATDDLGVSLKSSRVMPKKFYPFESFNISSVFRSVAGCNERAKPEGSEPSSRRWAQPLKRSGAAHPLSRCPGATEASQVGPLAGPRGIDTTVNPGALEALHCTG